MRKYQPLPWFYVKHGHLKVPVVLSSKKLTPQLRDCIGVVHDGKGGVCIYIDAASDRAVQDVSVLHELGHLSTWHLVNDKDEEENYVEWFSAGTYPILESLGFRWPRRPKGAAALEKWARK